MMYIKEKLMKKLENKPAERIIYNKYPIHLQPEFFYAKETDNSRRYAAERVEYY